MPTTNRFQNRRMKQKKKEKAALSYAASVTSAGSNGRQTPPGQTSGGNAPSTPGTSAVVSQANQPSVPAAATAPGAANVGGGPRAPLQSSNHLPHTGVGGGVGAPATQISGAAPLQQLTSSLQQQQQHQQTTIKTSELGGSAEPPYDQYNPLGYMDTTRIKANEVDQYHHR